MPAERSAVPETDETEANVTFASLGVPAPLVAVLAGEGIISPFPVQAATLPAALAGRDILGRAQIGQDAGVLASAGEPTRRRRDGPRTAAWAGAGAHLRARDPGPRGAQAA